MAADPRGDMPRKIVVCNPSEAAEIQRGIVHDLGHTDVLVRPNELIEVGHAYVLDGDALDGPITVSSWEF